MTPNEEDQASYDNALTTVANEKASMDGKEKSDFSLWWDLEGSNMRPYDDEDTEEFDRRIASYAWFCANRKIRYGSPRAG